MVLGGRADHGRPADVDILDAGREVAAAGHGLLEGIEVHIDDIDGADAVLGHGLGVVGGVANPQQAPMDHRVQGLDPAVHHLREAGEVGHVLHRQARRSDRRLGAAGGDQLHPHLRQRPGGLHQAGLVGHRQEGADGFHGVGGRREVGGGGRILRGCGSRGGGGHGGLLAGKVTRRAQASGV